MRRTNTITGLIVAQVAALVAVSAPRTAHACDPMPPHLAAAQPEAGSTAAPQGGVAILQVPLLPPGTPLSVQATVDGAPVPATMAVLPYAPVAAPQVFRDGALAVITLDAAAPAGAVALTVPEIVAADLAGPAVLAYTTVAGAPPALEALPTATVVAYPWESRDIGTCGTDAGHRLDFTIPPTPGAVAVRVRAEDRPTAADTTAVPVTGGLFPADGSALSLQALIDGRKDGMARGEICWRLEVVDALGALHLGDRVCTALPPPDIEEEPDDGGLLDDWCGEGAEGSDGAPDGDTGDTGAESAHSGCEGSADVTGCGSGLLGALAVGGLLGVRRRRS